MKLCDASKERSVWLRAGTLLDGIGAEPRRDVHVVYNAGKILFVGEAGNSPPADLLNPGQREPDWIAPGMTLLPGLIEAHAHLFLEGGELNLQRRSEYLKQDPPALLQAAVERLPRLVRLGVTAVRDAGDKDGVGLAISAMYNSPSHPLMPYLDSPGPALHHTGRYGGFMGEAVEKHHSLRDCVEARVKAGAYRIKIIPTGIINFKRGAVTSEPQMTTEEVAEIVAAAKSLGKQTFAHASGDTGIERAIEGGVDSVEHGYFIREDQLSRMRDRQIAWVPTFAPVREQVDHADEMGWDEGIVSNLRRILDQHSASLLKGREMGVRIIAGSDAGSVGVAHGLGLIRELELMAKAGMRTIDVINSATGAGARRLGFSERFGAIEAGARSRFILTRHSPLEAIANLRRERVVIFDGTVLESGGDEVSDGL